MSVTDTPSHLSCLEQFPRRGRIRWRHNISKWDCCREGLLFRCWGLLCPWGSAGALSTEGPRGRRASGVVARAPGPVLPAGGSFLRLLWAKACGGSPWLLIGPSALEGMTLPAEMESIRLAEDFLFGECSRAGPLERPGRGEPLPEPRARQHPGDTAPAPLSAHARARPSLEAGPGPRRPGPEPLTIGNGVGGLGRGLVRGTAGKAGPG